jgi:tRNA-specific 2-thiouridylase
MRRKLIAVAISGGVDSSAAAMLLKKSGHEVIGFHMRLWYDARTQIKIKQSCNKLEVATERAERVCDALGIPFHLIDLKDIFRSLVVEDFCYGYRRGRTPNPCIVCNKYIKFGLLLEKAMTFGADYLATGHYARVEHFDGAFHLLKGVDATKDQSYVLYTLGQEKLSRILFPLGDFLKTKVRTIAMQNGLPTATVRGSQDICFIDGRYSDFLSHNIDAAIPGEIINGRGEVLGCHRGIQFYTIGQRQKLGLTAERPLYVTKIEPEHNRIVVGAEEELYSRELIAREINWIPEKRDTDALEVTAKVRYKSPDTAATVHTEASGARVNFYQPQRAVTPGQAVVFYKNSEVIGGGTIEKTEK